MTDKYVNSNLQSGELAAPVKTCGADMLCIATTFEVAAADADGDVYRIAKGLSPRLVPIQIKINNDAITGGTDWDLGLYDPELGAVIDKDVFVDGATLASARVMGAELDGMTALNISSVGKTLQELAGDTNSSRPAAYDIALTANTVGTAAGTVSVRMIFAQGL